MNKYYQWNLERLKSFLKQVQLHPIASNLFKIIHKILGLGQMSGTAG